MTKKTVSAKTKRSGARAKAGRPSLQDTDKTRNALLEAATSLFAQKGFDGTSVKDIADKAGVNISLVSYHFDGKEGLYRTCVSRFGEKRLASTERILQPPQTAEEARFRLEMFIDDMLDWFHEEPELCAIIQREAEMNFARVRDVFEATFLKVFLLFISFVKTGQTKAFLRSDIDASIGARLYFGGLMNMLKSDDVSKRLFGVSVRDPGYRKKLKDQVCILFFEGLRAGSATPAKPKRGVRK